MCAWTLDLTRWSKFICDNSNRKKKIKYGKIDFVQENAAGVPCVADDMCVYVCVDRPIPDVTFSEQSGLCTTNYIIKMLIIIVIWR